MHVVIVNLIYDIAIIYIDKAFENKPKNANLPACPICSKWLMKKLDEYLVCRVVQHFSRRKESLSHQLAKGSTYDNIWESTLLSFSLAWSDSNWNFSVHLFHEESMHGNSNIDFWL